MLFFIYRPNSDTVQRRCNRMVPHPKSLWVTSPLLSVRMGAQTDAILPRSRSEGNTVQCNVNVFMVASLLYLRIVSIMTVDAPSRTLMRVAQSHQVR